MSANAYLPEYDNYITEIQNLHKARQTRLLNSMSSITGKRLGEASMRDQSVRSRCVEICMQLVSVRRLLAQGIDSVRNYILSEYNEEMVDLGFSTVASRNQVVENYLSKHYGRLSGIDTIVEIADLVIKDCDQAGFSLKRATDALAIAMTRERG